MLITKALLRRRAEHNDGMLTSLREIALHGQSIERITLLNQLCRHLRILLLQNNLICRIENLSRLKELERLNLAVNNLCCVENLEGCESLSRLDLTLNFIGWRGLITVASLRANEHLRELHLTGNPCTAWQGYRALVVAMLPQLQWLDGEEITAAERADAVVQLAELMKVVKCKAAAEGPDQNLDANGQVLAEADSISETGHLDERGELRRPWCPATRILEHREEQREAAAAVGWRHAAQARPSLHDTSTNSGMMQPQYRQVLPVLLDGEIVRQKNEGGWDYAMDESADGLAVVLDVDVGRYLDNCLIQADVQPTFVRLLVKGRLLQLLLPAEVRPDVALAQRSQATGRLVITMPLESHGPRSATWDVTRERPACGTTVRRYSCSSSSQQHARCSAAGAATLVRGASCSGLDAAAVTKAKLGIDDEELPCL